MPGVILALVLCAPTTRANSRRAALSTVTKRNGTVEYSGPRDVYVFPIPGGMVAMPQTQITFRGIPASELGAVAVTGSLSGPHTGEILGDSDGRGGSFLPTEPFTPGETVTVSTHLNVVGGAGGTFQFTVAKPAGSIPIGHRPPARRVRGDVDRFRSAPGLVPPAIQITRRGRAGHGYIFLAPNAGPVQLGPMIVGLNGRLIWFKPLPDRQTATDVRVQSYRGQPVLTWWQGNLNRAGIGQGEGVIDDSAYRTLHVVHAANGLQADLHEFDLTPQGTALITALEPIFWSTAGLRGGGTQTVVMDSVVQEIDIPTGLVLFEWDSLDHIPVADSYRALDNQPNYPNDYFHVNSIQQDRDGNLIVSSRNTWAAYKINHDTGQVMWTLGGKRSSFKMGARASFAYQHDVRVHGQDDNMVTLFDDGGWPRVHPQSRGLTLRLDFRHMRATVERQDEHRPPIITPREGNDELLPDGGSFIGWGQAPDFTEFNAQGKVVLDGHFVDANSSYRVYLERWTGQPASRPAIALRSSGRFTTVYVSWNGATTVRRWRILAGNSPRSLRAVAVAAVRGFETRIRIRRERYLEAQALGDRGRTLGRSAVVR